MLSGLFFAIWPFEQELNHHKDFEKSKEHKNAVTGAVRPERHSGKALIWHCLPGLLQHGLHAPALTVVATTCSIWLGVNEAPRGACLAAQVPGMASTRGPRRKVVARATGAGKGPAFTGLHVGVLIASQQLLYCRALSFLKELK